MSEERKQRYMTNILLVSILGCCVIGQAIATSKPSKGTGETPLVQEETLEEATSNTSVDSSASVPKDYEDYKSQMNYIVSSSYVLLEVKKSETFRVAGDKKYIKLTLVAKDEPGYSLLEDEQFTRVYSYDYYKEKISKSDREVDLIPTVVERCFLTSGKRNKLGYYTGGVVTSFQSMDKALNMDDIDALVDTMYAYDSNLSIVSKDSITSALTGISEDSDDVRLIPTYDESYYRLITSDMTTLPKVMLYGSDNRQLAPLKKLTQAKLREELNTEIDKAKRYFAGGVSERSYTDYSGEFENYKRVQKETAISEIQKSKNTRDADSSTESTGETESKEGTATSNNYSSSK